ncbi:hypothetical protein QR680_010255 [Steinernema hermaphroditum]|uniref:Uncharacterized protein n=1 Tax=Steinernema hermaphroditum TaxID=289476 RepID=A0AA39MBD8_9BILA|nr:hypothetical protein QR680_010255 [Steinernema hermaphroditum]
MSYKRPKLAGSDNHTEIDGPARRTRSVVVSAFRRPERHTTPVAQLRTSPINRRPASPATLRRVSPLTLRRSAPIRVTHEEEEAEAAISPPSTSVHVGIPSCFIDTNKALDIVESNPIQIDEETRTIMQKSLTEGKFEFDNIQAMNDFKNKIGEYIRKGEDKMKSMEAQVEEHTTRFTNANRLMDLWNSNEEAFRTEGLKLLMDTEAEHVKLGRAAKDAKRSGVNEK